MIENATERKMQSAKLATTEVSRREGCAAVTPRRSCLARERN